MKILYEIKPNKSTRGMIEQTKNGSIFATVHTGWRSYNGVWIDHTKRFVWDCVPSNKKVVESLNKKAIKLGY